ncbi:MAG: putative transporter [Porphyromonadaceae bacterium]|nr:putative transporter [Porphyromonadaceae bacterium]
MTSILSWLRDLFLIPSSTQTLIVLAIVSAIGLLLGKIKVGRVSLGVTFVFFVGILAAHLGVVTDGALTSFAQSLGLVLFVYALGVEVGPSFFPSLKSRGIAYNLYGLMLIVMTYILILGLHYGTGISMPNMLGIMSGAVTNTPVLAAIQSTLQATYPDATEMITTAAMATAVTYPLGVIGVILALVVLHSISPKRTNNQTEEVRATYVAEFEILNPRLCGHTVQELVALSSRHFIISRIWRDGTLIMPTSQTQIEARDHVLILCHEDAQNELETFFGKRNDRQDWNRPDINWDAIDANLNSKRIIITNPEINGVKLATLKLRNKYGINITRVDRAGIELLPSPELYLQTGDRLTIVGEVGALSQVSKFLGNSIQMLDKPNLVSFFFGLCLGCLIGSIPLYLPGMSIPVRLGLAGGPIIIGILMGAFGPRLHMATYMTNSATQLIKQLGIIVYLAGLGLSSGAGFVNTLLHGGGLLWLGVGFVITVLPTLLVGFVCIKLFGRSFAETSGMLCGTMANPFALDYAVEVTQSRTSSVAYATVYPVAMFIRIISAQILLLFFL